MSVLVGDRLKELAIVCSPDCVWENIKYSEIDVRIGSKYWVEREGVGQVRSDTPVDENMLYEVKEVDSYKLKPNEFVKAELIETFALPSNVLGVFTLRSRLAQIGLEQSTSIILKPNWSGRLVLELKNQMQHTPLRLIRGSVIGQITFMECIG